MKTYNNKSSKPSSSASEPFFNQDKKGGFFSQQNEKNQVPFFNKSTIQLKRENSGESGIEIQKDNEKIAWFRFNLTLLGGVKVIVKQNLIDGKYQIDDVSSSSYGFTLGYSWEQTSYTVNIKGDIATIDVHGIINYNMLGVEGLGTVFSEQYHFRVKTNIKTGEEHSMESVDEN